MTYRFLFILLFLSLLLPQRGFCQSWPGTKDSLYSDALKEHRRIQVVVPGDYRPGGSEGYEMVYMLDGEWYMQQIPFIYNFAESSGYVPKAIFVLIPNTYVNNVNLRDRDFSPTPMNPAGREGHADDFHAFLKNELIPYVEKKYPASGARTLVGSSFSGLFAVYAFVKEPALFNAYIASDPNLNWDNGYVSKLAARKFATTASLNSTLFIAGLERSFKGMGIAEMDSVLKAKAPAGLHWQCIPYANETHYSVQHKAFYDGFRFVHLGYSKSLIEFHPTNGIAEKGKPLKAFVPVDFNPVRRITTDGTEPTPESPVLPQGELNLPGPVPIKIRSFAHREAYNQTAEGVLRAGEAVTPVESNKPVKAGLTFSRYDGVWEKVPDLTKLKPTESGPVADGFNINQHTGKASSLYVVEGYIDLPEDAYCVFLVNAVDGSKLFVNKQPLISLPNGTTRAESFGAPMKKGLHHVRVEMLRKRISGEVHFWVMRTKEGNDRWWETRVMQL